MKFYQRRGALLFFGFLLSFSAKQSTCTELTIQNEAGIPEAKLSQLREITLATLNDFERRAQSAIEFPIRIKIAASHCLQTEYDFESQAIVFCKNRNVVNYGLNSDSVIRHEIFHALTCGLRPDLCRADRSGDTKAALEAIADFFAYTLHPEENFGSGFYMTAPTVRSYRSSRCYSLAEGAHGKGSAIVAALIKNQIPFSKVVGILKSRSPLTSKNLLEEETNPCFSAIDFPAIDVKTENYPKSLTHRYWLLYHLPIILHFQPNPVLKRLYPSLRISFGKSEEKFEIATLDSGNFQISSLGRKGIEKITFEFWQASELLGTQTFYFGFRG